VPKRFDLGTIRLQVQVPAAGLMLTALIECMFWLYILFMPQHSQVWDKAKGWVEVPGPNLFEQSPMPIFILLFATGFLMLGAISLHRLESYGFTIMACIVGIIPLSPAAILGIPFGIWGLMLLCKPEVI